MSATALRADALARPIYSRTTDAYTNLLRAAALVERGDRAAATACRELLQSLDPQGRAHTRLVRYFAQALLDRVEASAGHSGNLYAATRSAAGPADMLLAFQTLVDATPVVRFGYQVANSAILRAIESARSVHVIDVGIGQGTQWDELLHVLAARSARPHELIITGIDIPSADDPRFERLRAVGQRLVTLGAQLGVPVSFRPIAAFVEQLDTQALVADVHGEALVVNAAFALHHVPADDAVTVDDQSRDALLRRLAALRPRVLTLVEPDVEHNQLPFGARLVASFHHYTLVFEALEALLYDSPYRAILEEWFFGREIVNIVAHEGPARVERHESRDAWSWRMQWCGFRPLSAPHVAEGQRVPLVDPRFGVQITDSMELLTWKGNSQIAASAWTSA